jgi:hypothetical protein
MMAQRRLGKCFYGILGNLKMKIRYHANIALSLKTIITRQNVLQ